MTLLLWIGLAVVVSFAFGLAVGKVLGIGRDLEREDEENDDTDHEWPRHTTTWRSRHRMH